MGRSKLTPREEALKPIIAGNIKKYLNKFNKKPADLQRGTGIAQSTISDYTSGKTLVNPGNIEKIASFFGILKSDIDPRFSDEWVSENEFPIIEKTIDAMKQLEEPRQKIVLDTASSQLEEQKKENAKVVSIKTEQQKQGIDLADLVDDSKVDWDKWVSFDGRPLTDDVKEAMKRLLGKRLEDK
ncbi:MAG: helix-turn-helix domain-containing protein [Lactococcus lactis]